MGASHMDWGIVAAVLSGLNIFGWLVALSKVSFWAGGVNADIATLKKDISELKKG
jgi:hypothetical protein